MLALKFKQLQYESDSWKRMLDFMMDENIHLKDRLSEVLKEGFDNNLLEEVENFHSRFIREDELIRLMRHDLNELDNLLVQEIFENGMLKKKVDKRMKQMRGHITKAERQFCRLKKDFSSYLAEHII